MPQILLTGQLVCASASEAATVLRCLPLHIDLTRAEPGCISFEVSRTADPLTWQVDEWFANADAFEAHRERASASEWGLATSGIERRYTVQQIESEGRTATDGNRVLGRPRRPSPMGGRRPARADLAQFATDNPNAVDDILPVPGSPMRMLIVGINPGLWTAAVNAPFAHPGNRFWPSLFRAGLTDHLVSAAAGLDPEDEAQLLKRGIGLTNLVGRATARADQLSRDELRAGGAVLVDRLSALRPSVVAIAGITAFRAAYSLPKAQLGQQDSRSVPGWPPEVQLWVLPQPSGLNAHENIDSLAARWREAWRAAGAED